MSHEPVYYTLDLQIANRSRAGAMTTAMDLLGLEPGRGINRNVFSVRVVYQFR